MANQNQQERKQYTDISIITALSSDGNSTYKRVTLPKVFINAEKVSPLRTTGTGKTVCDVRMPVNNRGEFIGKQCGGLMPIEDANGTSWAKLSFWGETAERLHKFLERHPKCVLTVEGSIKVSESHSNGTTYINTDIMVDRWTFQRDTANNSGSAAANNGSTNTGSASAPASVPNGVNEFTELGDDYDDELPF